MAINKKLIHFKKFSDFNSKKLSANEANTQYTVGISGDVQNGNPDILYESIVWIKDTKQQWTHGQLYDGSKSDTPLNETDPVFSASPAASITEAKKTEWDNKADDSLVVHLSGEETITGVKTYRGRVNFLGDGDSNAMYLSTNTRLNVNGTTNTVLGFSAGTFLINNAAYTLTLRGKDPRPKYNGALLALYSDIPSAVTETTVSGWGFTKNPGTYSKPSGGIPKSDLDDAVQTSINRADNSLQIEIFGDMEITTLNGIAGGSTGRLYALPYESTGDEDDTLLSRTTVKTINGESIYGSGDITISGGSGTITEIKANGTSVATSGVANIPAATTSAYGVTKLTSSTSSTSTTLAATASAVKAAYDLANSYKGTVTGVKINGSTKSPSSGVVDLGTVITTHQVLKTINGQSIVGSGDITISGGSSDANVQAVDTGDVLDDVTVDYATKTYVDELVGDINSVLESIING